jgi:chromosome partitioning protein
VDLVEMPVRKLLIASQRSGVGTTTTAIHLATGAARAGARVLLIDADPVGSISSVLDVGRRGQRRELRALGIELPGGLWHDVAPGLDVLSPCDEGLFRNDQQEALLQALDTERCRERYGCVIVDTPPFMGERPRHLLCHCNDLVLVLRAEPVAFRTLPLFFETVKTIEREDGGVALRGILLTQPAPGSCETDLRRYLGSKVFGQTIPIDPEVDQVGAATGSDRSPAALLYKELVSALELGGGASAQAGMTRRPARVPATAVAGQSGRSRRSAARLTDDFEDSWKRPRPRPGPAVASPGTEPAAAAACLPARRRSARSSSAVRPWHVWIGAGMLSGTFLGSVRSPEYVLPAAVGLATTAGVVLAMQLLGRTEGADKARKLG